MARKDTENRAGLAAMSDDELLAYQREQHGDPYMSLGTAKELRKIALKFSHLGATKECRDDEGRVRAEHELWAKVFPQSR